MPEEPNDINQPQPQSQPLPSTPQSQPISRPSVAFSPEKPIEVKSFDTPMLEPAPEPEMLPEHTEEPVKQVTDQSLQTAYAPQPQFETQNQQPEGSAIFSQPVSQPEPRKKNKNRVIIGAVVAGILVLLGGGSVLAYNVWYSNPDKVISDAVINAITAKNPIYTGKLAITSKDVNATVEITTKQADVAGSLDAKVSVTTGGKDYSVNGGAIFDASGDLYFKVGGLDAVAKEIQSQYSMQISGVDDFVKAVDNKWIKVSSNDLKSYSESYATSKTCINDTIKKFKDNSTVLTEVTDLYKVNPFIVIKDELAQKDGSFGYLIETDNTKVKAFAESLKKTRIYTELHNCDSAFTINTADMFSNTSSSSKAKNTVELWINSWSHQITEFKVTSDDNGQKTTLTIDPKYNQDVKITAPAESITLAQLQTEIEKLTNSITSAMNAESSGIYY